MAEIAYVTLEEAAELEGISYETIKKRVQRKADGMEIRKESRNSGGKEQILVSVNDLSKPARNAWKERQRLNCIADTQAELPESGSDGGGKMSGKPWYVDMDLEWFMHQYKKKYYEAAELGNVIREVVQYKGSDRTAYMNQLAQERLGKDGRTLYRKVKAYQEAAAWAAKLEKEDGCSYDYLKVLALCRKPKEAGSFPSIPADMKQAIKNIWFNKDFALNRNNRNTLYEILQEIAAGKGWKKIPSYPTVVRYIDFLMDECGMRSAYDYLQKGIRGWKNENMVKRCRDTKSLKVLEMLQGDEHTFDLWVLHTDRNGKQVPIRPKLVCWIDTRSRMILGDIICRDADSLTLKESLIKLMYVDLPGLVPRYLYIDNGKDYTSKGMIGVDRKDRHNQEAKDRFFDMEFDRVTRGFYHDIGIEDEHISMPYEPWTKAQIERSFGSAAERLSKRFRSYTGTLTGSSTDAKVPKEIKRMAERGELLTKEEFYEEWKKYKAKYNSRVHNGLKKAGEEYHRPLEVFENAERYIKAAPPRSRAIMALMKTEEARVNNTGIRRNGYYYMHEDLLGYINQTVTIKIDPYDATSIYVLRKDGGMLCKAPCQELLQFGRVADETLKLHRKMQKHQLKAVQQAIEEANVPFDGDTEGAHKGMVGGVQLTIGKDPVRTGKVVSMPQDAAWRKNRDMRNGMRSGYMDSQAQKALERLQKIEGA